MSYRSCPSSLGERKHQALDFTLHLKHSNTLTTEDSGGERKPWPLLHCHDTTMAALQRQPQPHFAPVKLAIWSPRIIPIHPPYLNWQLTTDPNKLNPADQLHGSARDDVVCQTQSRTHAQAMLHHSSHEN